MARISARMPMIAKRTETETEVTFSGGAAIGKLVKSGVTPNQPNTKLFADDGIAEEESEVTSAAVTIESTTIPKDCAVMMFGIKFTEKTETEPEQAVFTGEEDSNFVGYGFIGGDKVDGKKRYKISWLPKVKFVLPSEEYTTRGESISFGTSSISGTAYRDDVLGYWKKEFYFDTAKEAVDYLKTLTGKAAA